MIKIIDIQNLLPNEPYDADTRTRFGLFQIDVVHLNHEKLYVFVIIEFMGQKDDIMLVTIDIKNIVRRRDDMFSYLHQLDINNNLDIKWVYPIDDTIIQIKETIANKIGHKLYTNII